jgi:hypothetical protein
MQGKRGVWLKILLDQADLVPIAIQVMFQYPIIVLCNNSLLSLTVLHLTFL